MPGHFHRGWPSRSTSPRACQDFGDWSLKDEDGDGHTWAFLDGYMLDAGTGVKVHVWSGEDTSTDLYWGRGVPSGITAGTQLGSSIPLGL